WVSEMNLLLLLLSSKKRCPQVIFLALLALASFGCATTATHEENGDERSPVLNSRSSDKAHPNEEPITSPISAAEKTSRLAESVARLGEEVKARSPGTELGIAVHVLSSRNERAEYRSDAAQQSASAVKIVWVAAALDRRSVAALEHDA